jgi:raffinose/stachyose/melibiose transport system permease protein
MTKPRSFVAEISRNAACYAFMLPTLALLVTFVLVPFVWAFRTSLFQYEIGEAATWVGIANYLEYFQDPTLIKSFLNMAFLTTFAVVVRMIVPLVVAKLIVSLPSERSRYFYRILFLVPIVVPGVAVQLIWRDLVFGEAGLLNELLRLIEKDEWVVSWFNNPRTALLTVACVGFPFVGGFEVLIYYAGLSSISEDINDAAQIDGAGGLRKFFTIDVPLVLSQLKLIVVLTIIAGVQGFENIFILTRGGPGFQTLVPGLWMYFNAFSFQRMGYACAIGVILFGLIFTLTALNMRYFRSTEELQAR